MKLSDGLAVLVLVGIVGCGDDSAMVPDGGMPGGDACLGGCFDAPARDGGSDAPMGTDGGTDGGGIVLPTDPVVIPLSATGHDRAHAITHDADGNVLATGQIADSIETTADFELFVAKVTPDGVLDDTFGTNGITRVNVTVGGTNREVARGIVVQSTGRIVIGATAEHDPTAVGLLSGDTDIVLVGFTPDGMLDDTFGTAGIERIDVGTGVVTTNAMGVDVLAGADTQWGLALASSDRLVIHGATRAPDTRTDTDYAVLRRLADGAVDDSFDTDGLVTLDIGMTNAGARSVTVLADDSIIAAGYTTSSVLTRPDALPTSQQPVIYHLLVDGQFDTAFATADVTTTPGVWHDFATPAPDRRNAEAYGAAVLSDGRFVTIGYGPTPIATGTATDLVSFRFSSAGVIDPTYGTAGLTYADVGMLGDVGRFIAVLPDDRTLSVGGGRPAPPSGGMEEQDALVFVLSADGTPDAAFGENGLRIFDLGGTDQFWGASVREDAAGNWVAIGGIAAAPTMTDDDDTAFYFVAL